MVVSCPQLSSVPVRPSGSSVRFITVERPSSSAVPQTWFRFHPSPPFQGWGKTSHYLFPGPRCPSQTAHCWPSGRKTFPRPRCKAGEPVGQASERPFLTTTLRPPCEGTRMRRLEAPAHWAVSARCLPNPRNPDSLASPNSPRPGPHQNGRSHGPKKYLRPGARFYGIVFAWIRAQPRPGLRQCSGYHPRERPQRGAPPAKRLRHRPPPPVPIGPAPSPFSRHAQLTCRLEKPSLQQKCENLFRTGGGPRALVTLVPAWHPPRRMLFSRLVARPWPAPGHPRN